MTINKLLIIRGFLAIYVVAQACYGSGFMAPAWAQTPPPAPVLPVEPADNQGGMGNLLVAPTRAVLEGRHRAAEITLSNRGQKATTYRIEFTHLRMDDSGKYIEISEEEAKTALPLADSLLRYSPRQVTLEPGQSQIVKIVARKPQGLTEGEYISHLMFKGLPDASVGEDVEAANSPDNNISIRLIPVYGVSIPVIVRHGNLSAVAGMNPPQRTGNELAITLTRSGNRSLFGDLTAEDANGRVVGQVRGVAVLVPNAKRTVKMTLSADAKAPLRVSYRAREEEGGRELAHARVP